MANKIVPVTYYQTLKEVDNKKIKCQKKLKIARFVKKKMLKFVTLKC